MNRARARLEGQLHECEERIAIYRDRLESGDLNDIRDIQAYEDVLKFLHEHRIRFENALEEIHYS